MTLAFDTDLVCDESHVFLEDVSWASYVSIRRDFDRSCRRKRIVYNRGRILVVSPLPKHERWKSLLGRFVQVITDERDIPIATLGQSTWRRKKKRGGLEADECFYIQNEPLVRGRLDINLRRDPPPDLAIEVDLRPYLAFKLEVYARLKIPEVWNYDGIDLLMFALQENGEYNEVSTSRALPFLKPEHLKGFLSLFTQMDENSLIREVRKWAKELKP
jgi:Uma2 family endonuclease